jgi:hypothetical protein
VNKVGNWSADKSGYYTITDINNFNTSYLNTTNATYNTWAYNQTIPANAYTDIQNTSMKNYVDAQNTSQTNYINSNNQSIVNTLNLYVLISTLIDRVGNWSADKVNYYTKTDINNFNESYLNTTNSSYLPLTGGTMTGNLNLSANVNLTMNGGNQIGSNITCVTIKGATSVLEIC